MHFQGTVGPDSSGASPPGPDADPPGAETPENSIGYQFPSRGRMPHPKESAADEESGREVSSKNASRLRGVADCVCDVCLKFPRLGAALDSMRPPRLRLYRHEELQRFLEEDLQASGSAALEASSCCLWHLCERHPRFPLYEVFT